MESKRDIYNLIPPGRMPVTLLFNHTTPVFKVAETVIKHNLRYPLILKPDIGMQGKAVIKVCTESELLNAASQFTVDYIMQPFISFPNEVGIFYVRYPGDSKGKITGIVEKVFLEVTGDGISTIEQLLCQDDRHKLQIPALQKDAGINLSEILEINTSRILVPYGNHARGSLFLDVSHKINEKIERVIDEVCRSIPGFYYGRLDIRFTNFQDLEGNKNWSIIELNGAGSEPTHIYDPRHSIFFAWKEIIRHWGLLYNVSKSNRKKGEKYLTYREGIKMFRDNQAYVKKLGRIEFINIHPRTL